MTLQTVLIILNNDTSWTGVIKPFYIHMVDNLILASPTALLVECHTNGCVFLICLKALISLNAGRASAEMQTYQSSQSGCSIIKPADGLAPGHLQFEFKPI